jgi:HSP20 family protein
MKGDKIMRSLVRRFDNPLSYLERFFDEDNWFVRGFDQSTAGRVNIVEGKNDFTIEVSAPGFKKEDLDIKIHDGVITVSGEIRNEKNENGDTYSRREFSSQSFTRSFSIPEEITEDGFDAKFEDGILKVKVNKPKELPKADPKQIQIK